MHFARLVKLSLKAGVNHSLYFFGSQVGNNRNNSVSAQRQKRQSQSVVSTKNREAWMLGLYFCKNVGHLVDVAAGFLNADDVGQFGDARQSVRGDVGAGSSLNVVNQNRKADFADSGEVAVNALLAWLVVIGRHDQSGVGPGFLGALGVANRVASVVASSSDDDRDVLSCRLFERGALFHYNGNHLVFFVFVKSGSFACCAKRNKAVDSGFELVFNVFPKSFVVNRAVLFHRRNHRCVSSLQL